MLEDNNKIGEKIKEIRDRHRLSQERFAKRLGLSSKSISAYETNRSIPPLRVLEKISEVYNVSLIKLPEKTRDSINKKLASYEQNINEIRDLLNNGLTL